MRRVRLAARGLPIAIVVLAACAGGDDAGSAGVSTAVDSGATTPTFVGDGSAFCDAMLGVGQVERSVEDTPEDVLAENDLLLGHLDAAQANAPSDAPPDFDALLEDYRVASLAIAASGGDVAAAFVRLEEEDPEVFERLGSSTSHAEAYAFLVSRCGIAAP